MLPEGVELEFKACPVGCPPGDRELLTSRDRLGGRPGLYRVVECLTCGLLRTDPRPTPASMGAYYGDDYGPYSVPASLPTGKRNLKQRLAGWLGLDTRRLPAVCPGRLLEVGCAAGEYMRFAQQAGWEVEGIEFSAEVAQLARERGLRVQASTVEEAAAPLASYDLIVGWMVLEHLHSPVDALARLRSWTKPGGYLVISVPDAGSLERRVFRDAWYALQAPTHLYHYSPRTLRRVLEVSGWRMVAVRWQPNANNFLLSLAYKFEDWGMGAAASTIRRAAQSRKLATARLALGAVLAFLRQSGRIEVIAQPNR